MRHAVWAYLDTDWRKLYIRGWKLYIACGRVDQSGGSEMRKVNDRGKVSLFMWLKPEAAAALKQAALTAGVTQTQLVSQWAMGLVSQVSVAAARVVRRDMAYEQMVAEERARVERIHAVNAAKVRLINCTEVTPELQSLYDSLDYDTQHVIDAMRRQRLGQPIEPYADDVQTVEVA